jgi:hypothetical protein
MFKLDLPQGPYIMSVNPTNIYLAGSRGHIALFNWRTKQL